MQKIDIKQLFLGMQNEMIATLNAQKLINHPGTKGTATELNWLKWFEDYFPKRYCFGNGFVVDSAGNISDQIDIIVYDRQYSPLVFNQNGALYVTAESVYAVFEVKQFLSAETVKYAGEKAESVRKLFRTSAPIPHAGGVYPPKSLNRIWAGILASATEWKSPAENVLSENLEALSIDQQLDICCALSSNSYVVQYLKGEVSLEKNENDETLIFMFLKLLMVLQNTATVPAIVLQSYAKAIDSI